MLNIEHVQITLRNAGIRLTPQRLMVVGVLADNRTHPTVDEIYARVKAVYPTMSLATVYHTLAMLAKHQLILELHGSKDGLRCDPETAPHAHGYCESCGHVYDLPLPTAVAWQEHELDGFKIEKAEVWVYGICAECGTS